MLAAAVCAPPSPFRSRGCKLTAVVDTSTANAVASRRGTNVVAPPGEWVALVVGEAAQCLLALDEAAAMAEGLQEEVGRVTICWSCASGRTKGSGVLLDLWAPQYRGVARLEARRCGRGKVEATWKAGCRGALGRLP